MFNFVKKWNQERLFLKRKSNVENSYNLMMSAYNRFLFQEDAKKSMLQTLMIISSSEELDQYANIFGRAAHEKCRCETRRNRDNESE